MKHLASSRFWALYHALQADVRQIADKNFTLLKSDPRHPSLHFKRIGELYRYSAIVRCSNVSHVAANADGASGLHQVRTDTYAMNKSDDNWWASVEAAVALGQRITGTSDELDQACGHIVRLLLDAISAARSRFARKRGLFCHHSARRNCQDSHRQVSQVSRSNAA